MKKGNVAVTRLARGVASTVAATALMANSHTSDAAPLRPTGDLLNTTFANVDSNVTGQLTEGAGLMWSVEHTPTEWDKKHEHEFRKLALLEVKGELTVEQFTRLNQLNRWRDELLCAPTVDEMLLQLRRDSLLSRMEKLLREYVEFEETTNKKRSTS